MHRITLFNQSIGLFLQSSRQGFLTAEQLDDELELQTGCRFGDPTRCQCPDCKHPPAEVHDPR
jgi:hypothetical protein